MRFRDFLLAFWMGMLPGTPMYVYQGATVKDVAELLSGGATGGIGQKVLFGPGLLATVAVTVFITRAAKQALDRAVTERAPGQETIVEEMSPQGAIHG